MNSTRKTFMKGRSNVPPKSNTRNTKISTQMTASTMLPSSNT